MMAKFFEDKQLSESTVYFYNSAVKLYEEITGKTIDELITEADLEEENGIRWKNRKIKNHLVEYRNYLYANKSEGTAKRYFAAIKTIYTHFEIELHSLPSFNSKQIDKTYKMDYEDLLTKEQLIDAYYEANNLFKCLITFGISSGLSKIDMLNLTVEDWIKSCERYITTEGLLNQLMELKNQNELIPCFKGNRQKTDSVFITFCSPEAAEHINQYLLGRDAKIREEYEEAEDKTGLPEKLEYTDKLFSVTKEHVTYTFKKINNKLNLGNVGKFGRFRCHMLRKFQASTLLNSEIVTWTVEEIDTLQGRSMDITHQAYFKNSREKLYNKYVECVDELMLFKSIHQVDEEEHEKVKAENNFYKKEIVKNERIMEAQQKKIDEIKKNQEELEAMILSL